MKFQRRSGSIRFIETRQFIRFSYKIDLAVFVQRDSRELESLGRRLVSGLNTRFQRTVNNEILRVKLACFLIDERAGDRQRARNCIGSRATDPPGIRQRGIFSDNEIILLVRKSDRSCVNGFTRDRKGSARSGIVQSNGAVVGKFLNGESTLRQRERTRIGRCRSLRVACIKRERGSRYSFLATIRKLE